MKNKTKSMTLMSGIIEIIMGILLCVSSILVVIYGLARAGDGDAGEIVVFIFGGFIFWLFIFIIILGLGGMFIGFGAVEIKLSTLDNFEYSQKKAVVVGYSVFNAIAAIVGAICAYIFSSYIFGLIVGIAATTMSILCIIFKCADWAIFNKKVEKGVINVDARKSFTTQGINLAALDPDAKKDEKTDAEKLEIELKKLEELKSGGLINEEEYQKMRAKAIEDNMNN